MTAPHSISIYEYCVRFLRWKRVSMEYSVTDLRTKAKEFERDIGADATKMLADSELPGPIDGYPHKDLR